MFRINLTICLLTALLLAVNSGPVQAAEQLTLELRTTATISGTQFSVADLVSSHSGREDFWQAIRTEMLGSAKCGQPVQLGQDELLGLLAAKGYDWRLLSLQGAASIEIRRAGNAVSAAEICSMLETKTSAALGCEVQLVGISEHPLLDQQFDSGELEMQLRWTGTESNSLPDAVVFRLDGRLERVLPLRQYFEFSLPVLTSRTQLQRGDLLQPQMLDRQVLNCPPGSSVISDPLLAAGLQATRRIEAGSRLDMDNLTRPWNVERNQVIRLLSSSTGLSASAEGKAGYLGKAEPTLSIGDRISVKRSLDGQSFMGVVTDNGVVVIE